MSAKRGALVAVALGQLLEFGVEEFQTWVLMVLAELRRGVFAALVAPVISVLDDLVRPARRL